MHEALKQAFTARDRLRQRRQPVSDHALGVAAIAATLFHNESLPPFETFCNLEELGYSVGVGVLVPGFPYSSVVAPNL
jgi:hypothetical protein